MPTVAMSCKAASSNLHLLEILPGISFPGDTNLRSTETAHKYRPRWGAQQEELGNLFDVESSILFIHLG